MSADGTFEPGRGPATNGDDTMRRAATWMVGGRLASALHLGDGSLAYELSQAGHEVVVCGDDVERRRDPEVLYVRAQVGRLPFAPSAFDAVLVPELQVAPSLLAEYSRVLRPGGFISTVSRSHDVTVPWVRRLHEIVGHVPVEHDVVDTLAASGLFDEVESTQVGSWVQFDLPGLSRFAETLRPDGDLREVAAPVHALFREYGGQTGLLRLRAVTRCLRARSLKEPEVVEQPATVLFDLG